MGIIKQGILGGFSKKVGAVVGTSWKGIAVMKSMPQSVVNPKTTLQVKQRSAFKLTALIASAMLVPTIQECWNRWSKRMSGYNAFIKANVDIMKNNNSIVGGFLTQMIVSNGELTLPSLAGTSTDDDNSVTYTATWDGTATGGRYDKATDIVRIGLLVMPSDGTQPDLEQASVVLADGVARSAGTTSVTYEIADENTAVFPFMYVVSADGYFRSENLNYYSKLS